MKFRFFTIFASRWYQYNDHTTFQFSANRHQSWKFLKYSTQWGSKVNRFCHTLTPFLVNVSKSVSDIWIQEGIAIQKIFDCGISVIQFSADSFWSWAVETAKLYYGKYIPNGAYLQSEATVSQFRRHPSTHCVLFHSGLSLFYRIIPQNFDLIQLVFCLRAFHAYMARKL